MVRPSVFSLRPGYELRSRLGRSLAINVLLQLACQVRYLLRSVVLNRPRLLLRVVDLTSSQSLYIAGVLDDPQQQVIEWKLIFQNGSTLAIGSHVVLMPAKTGPLSNAKRDHRFSALIPLRRHEPSELPARLQIHMKSGRCKTCKVKLSSPGADTLTRISGILSHIPAQWDGKKQLYEDQIAPTVSELWRNRDKDCRTERLVRYNHCEKSKIPTVTLVIPIYRRYDFIEHQLTHFCNDAELEYAQILFVIDDPQIQEEVQRSCMQLALVKDIAFDVLFLTRNLGFAEANNRGAAHAQADLLLLLNSDVVPTAPGWLSQMIAKYRQHEERLILSARLLYEDGSIQHNGMRFERAPSLNDLWINRHPGKGLPADLFVQTDTLEECDAVTGACLMMMTEYYKQLGGLDDSYILGDFEDSDICLRARKAGFAVKLASNISLFHLERQSQSLVTEEPWKKELTYYNCWLHTRRWNAEISDMKLEHPK